MGQVSRTNTKAALGCLPAAIILMIVVAYFSSESFNPIATFSSRSILAKILAGFLAFMAASALIQLIGLFAVRKYVDLANPDHKAADDVICPGCGLPLIDFLSSHGAPLKCPGEACGGALWHNGPKCFNKGLPPGAPLFHLCPICRSAADDDANVLGFGRNGPLDIR